LLSAGLTAVGRPSCTGGVRHLIDLLADTASAILILGENDVREDGTWPGRDGAKAVATALARALGDRVRWVLPPEGSKDIRDYLNREGPHGESKQGVGHRRPRGRAGRGGAGPRSR